MAISDNIKFISIITKTKSANFKILTKQVCFSFKEIL